MKTYSILTALLFCASIATAQLIPSVGLHGYLTERVDINNVAPDEIELKGRTGWHAGFDWRLKKKMLYLQPGLHYYNTTTQVTDLRNVDLPQTISEQRHTSIKMPLQAGLRLGLNGTAAIHLQGGPVFTGSLKQELTNDLGGMRNFTAGVVTGVGVDILRFNAHVRYEWGLTQAFQNQAGSADVLSIGLGLVF